MAIQNTPLRFYYNSMLGSANSSLSASSTSATANHSVGNITNWLEIDSWQAVSSADAWILYDAAVADPQDADYLAIIGHNLNTAGANIALQSSTSGAFSGEESTLFSEVVSADTVFFKEFSTAGVKRYWRIVLTNMTTAPFVRICALGTKTTVAFIQPPFDPYAEDAKANVNISQGGYLTGIHTRHTERQFNINISNASTAVYQTVKDWRDNHGLKNFFMAWDSTANPSDVFLVRPNTRFNNPINADQLRNITINLMGRKE